MQREHSISRRDFLRTGATTAAVAMSVHPFFTSRAHGQERSMKMGVVGCGGRGTHITGKCLEAAQHLGIDMKVEATADAFKGKAEELGNRFGVPKSKSFGGFDSYRKLLECELDVVLLATPPNFRPLHFEAAVDADKHVFMEKPIAVDPPGARKVMATGKKASSKGLSVVAGTQRRHQKSYQEIQYQVSQGAIGDITGGSIYWCGGRLWFKKRKDKEDNASYLVRNWVNFTEMSGDHIVEQHVHNIDVANWFMGHPPVTAIGFGGRARRMTGNQFDFFSIDFDYGDDIHIHSMCRQINGCYNRVSEFFSGTNGCTWGNGGLKMRNAVEIQIPDFPELEGGDTQSHVELLRSILEESPINETRSVTEATLAALMGRTAAYTGKLVRWKEMVDGENQAPWCHWTAHPTAEDFEKGPVDLPDEALIPVPGED